MKHAFMAFALLSLALPGHAAGETPAANSSVRFLTHDDGAADYWPCFSPDGTKVLFSRSTDGGRTHKLFTVLATGGGLHEISTPSDLSATRANWSVQDRIAFTGSAGGKSHVWVMGGNGNSPEELERQGLSDQTLYPSWYPEGTELAVMDAGVNVVKRFGLTSGTPATNVTNRERILAGMPSVSPNGTTIAFAGQLNGGPYDQSKNQIWLIDPGHLAQRLEAVPQTPCNPKPACQLALIQGRAPSWSPDGNRIVFESNRDEDRYAVFVANRDGSGVTRITDPALGANHPVWSRDGRQMVFSAYRPENPGKTAIAIIDFPALR